jgi:hypothetical protein
MKINWQSFLFGVLFSFPLFADGYLPQPISQDQPWSFILSFGNGKYQHVYPDDSQSAIGRLAVGNELLLTGDYAVGVEVGLQNGNHLRLEVPDETLAVLGWYPVRSTLGPILDLLVTAKSDPLFGSDFFAQFKGGVAYRHWGVRSTPSAELFRLNGEFQAGIGYPMSPLANLSLLYQGVYGGNPNFYFNSPSNTNNVANIPTLHSLLFGFTVNI